MSRPAFPDGDIESAPLVVAVKLTVPAQRDEVIARPRLATALTVAEIAQELCLSVNTVRTHCRRLYRRLGVRTREGALRVARERNLL